MTDPSLTLSPTLSPTPKEEDPLNHHYNYLQQPYQNSVPCVTKNTAAIVKCKSTTENVAANADLSYEKPPTEAGLCCSLKTLDIRLEETLNSPEVCHAFEVLRVKMEKDYATKQLKKIDDNCMYFDVTYNYVSAEDIRTRYKKIFKSKEYLEAKKSLLLIKLKKQLHCYIVCMCMVF
jgi:hypothetical protein